MKKLMLLAAAALALVLVQGCASTQVADEFNGQKISTKSDAKDVAHILGSNWGIYCLSAPVVTGSTAPSGSTVWGKDTVNVKSVTEMVTAKSKELGATSTVDLQSSSSSFWIMPAFVLFYREIQVSGNAIK